MNGPGTDSLVIRHTPETVPGGARPGWGLPYQRLPQGRLTPESMLERETQTGRQAIQDKYALQWKTVNQGRRFIGAVKTQRMLQQIDMSAKQEMLQFNQQAEQQLAQLRNIDRLAQQGAIANPEEIKAREMFGPDIARSMYPTPERERTIPQQFGELDVYSHRISDELKWFKEDKSPKFPRYTKLLGPTGAGVLAKHYIKKARAKRKVWIYDPNTKDYTIKATPEKIAEYDMWLQEKEDVAKLKKELTGRLDISRRIVQPGTKGGTFGDKITESIKPQRQLKRQPTSIELRQRGTREAYEKGKRLKYWQ